MYFSLMVINYSVLLSHQELYWILKPFLEMPIGNENKAYETQLTSAGWAPQQGWFTKASCGTEWLKLWMIILCAALCCMALLKSAAGVPKIRASAGTLLTVRTCRDHWCSGSASLGVKEPTTLRMRGYILYQISPVCFSLFIGFLRSNWELIHLQKMPQAAAVLRLYSMLLSSAYVTQLFSSTQHTCTE